MAGWGISTVSGHLGPDLFHKDDCRLDFRCWTVDWTLVAGGRHSTWIGVVFDATFFGGVKTPIFFWGKNI